MRYPVSCGCTGLHSPLLYSSSVPLLLQLYELPPTRPSPSCVQPYVHIVRNIYTIRVKPQWPDSEPCSCGGGGGGGGASSSRGGAAAAAAAAAGREFARFAACGEGCVNRLLRVECRCVPLWLTRSCGLVA